MTFIHCTNPDLEEQVTKSCPICNPKPKVKEPENLSFSQMDQLELYRNAGEQQELLQQQALLSQGYYPGSIVTFGQQGGYNLINRIGNIFGVKK